MPVKNLWKDSQVKGKDALDQLVYRSRLIGSDPKLCLWGGGNTSTKTVEKSPFGGQVKVIWVKGSGSDMKVCERKHFAPLDLDKLIRLLGMDEMSDETMVDYIARAQASPSAPRASIEALLHTFVPHSDIDHIHADAILSITNNTRNRELVKKLYGSELFWIPYVKPGFALAKRVYEAFEKNADAKGAVLEKHGLITWGSDSKTSYRRMIEYVRKAEAFIEARAKGKKVFGAPAVQTLSAARKREFLARFLPLIRQAVSQNKRAILHFSGSPGVLEFANSKTGPRLSQIGPATPDHMLRTKGIPLFLSIRHSPIQLKESEFKRQIEAYAKAHQRYFSRFKLHGMKMLDPYPRVILIPGVGMIATGKDLASAKECAEIYEHSILAMRGAQATGRYESLPLRERFEMEYWSLELYKLSLAPVEKPLARKIALVTGAAGAIGRAIAKRLAEEGAHVFLSDLDLRRTEQAADEMNQKLNAERAFALKLDVTNEDSVRQAINETVLRLGGLDLVVSNAGVAHVSSVEELKFSDWERSLQVNATGHFLVAREAMKIFKKQALGGNLVFIATKNVMAPGKDFGAYSAAKSAGAQLAKILAIEGGEFGVRANIVNPDGIFEGSGLWSSEIRKDRAKSYKIPLNRLEDYYRNRNLLKAKVSPEDVAGTVFFLASDLSSKTTGCTVTVDGGVKEAFPR